MERDRSGALEARHRARRRHEHGERLGGRAGDLDVGAVAVGEAGAARVRGERVVGERLEPPVEDGEVPLAGAGAQAHDALPERPAYAPRAAVARDDARAHVGRAVHDGVEEHVVGGAGRAARRPRVAPLARQRGPEAVDARVAPVEPEVGVEEGARVAGEAVGGLVEVSEDRGVARRVRVLRAGAREVRGGARRVERQEEPVEELLGVHAGRLVARACYARARRAHPRRAIRGLDDAGLDPLPAPVAAARHARPGADAAARRRHRRPRGRPGAQAPAHRATAASTPPRAPPRREPAGARALALRTGQPSALAQVARAHHASWALALRLGALDEVMERFGARARRGDDLTAQALQLVTIAREMIDEGAIASWPQRLRGLPVPTAHVVRRTPRRPLPRRPRHRARPLRRRRPLDLLRRAPPRRRLRRHRRPRRAAARAGPPLRRLAPRLPPPRPRRGGALRPARPRLLRRRDALPRAADRSEPRRLDARGRGARRGARADARRRRRGPRGRRRRATRSAASA